MVWFNREPENPRGPVAKIPDQTGLPTKAEITDTYDRYKLDCYEDECPKSKIWNDTNVEVIVWWQRIGGQIPFRDGDDCRQVATPGLIYHKEFEPINIGLLHEICVEYEDPHEPGHYRQDCKESLPGGFLKVSTVLDPVMLPPLPDDSEIDEWIEQHQSTPEPGLLGIFDVDDEGRYINRHERADVLSSAPESRTSISNSDTAIESLILWTLAWIGLKKFSCFRKSSHRAQKPLLQA
eukprot:gnl/MRDRNA2_/MRDRNA2_134863_c0_seq1.p1 gnl/MRDRNA2_/MRDRNA2_134863_c0~~gnl/MRDRNA2_/MRDRNA2_134863_c0_seq1.p1  ORF type:complete len:237 (+),score=32.56 gnl/MRDRNA2_/MRDRNA2_134863_c0_seq1:165-875(+)